MSKDIKRGQSMPNMKISQNRLILPNYANPQLSVCINKPCLVVTYHAASFEHRSLTSNAVREDFSKVVRQSSELVIANGIEEPILEVELELMTKYQRSRSEVVIDERKRRKADF